MTQNEVSIIKNSVIDATEAYVEARLSVLNFVKTQIGVVLSYTRKSDNKYYHKVRCNATSNTSGIVYDNVLSVGNIPLPVGSVVFLIAPNAQYSNQFILGKLDTTPAHIEGGSIRLGGTDESNAPIYLTSEPYSYGDDTVYGHIGGFYITTDGLRIEGVNRGKSEITGQQVRVSEWKQISSTVAYGISMMMDTSNARIAINTDGYTNGGLIVSNAYGWHPDGSFNDPTSEDYIRITPTKIDFDIGSSSGSIGEGGLRFLNVNQDTLYGLRITVNNSGITFSTSDKSATLEWN